MALSSRKQGELNREHDQALIRDRKDGLSWRKLADKHKLSPGWVTETEYRAHMVEHRKRWLANLSVSPGQKFG